MSIEPIVALFFAWYIRKHFKTFFPDARDNKIMNWILIGMAALFILHVALPIEKYTNWLWYLLLLYTTYLVYTRPAMERMRTKMLAILPLISLQIISDTVKIFLTRKQYAYIDSYIDFAIVFAIAWMIAMLIRSNKQNKALEEQQEKTRLEEERNKFISAQKDKLEIIVAERTAEITKQKDELLHALTELKSTQTQLIHSEKMASLGELTAGIAHEIQNPLNFVNNFSEVNKELIAEMKLEIENGNYDEANSIANDVIANEEKINHHGKRADAIVKGMLQHSRSSNSTKELVDINALADEYLRLAYHGLRAKDKSFNATMKTDYDTSLEKINVIPQDIGRVVLNLISNAFYAVDEKKKTGIDHYDPTVSISTKNVNDKIEITVSDNGNGIPDAVKEKIFHPFFTTKPTGQGTGLGLSLAYDIVKAHNGELEVETVEGKGSAFTIQIPMV